MGSGEKDNLLLNPENKATIPLKPSIFHDFSSRSRVLSSPQKQHMSQISFQSPLDSLPRRNLSRKIAELPNEVLVNTARFEEWILCKSEFVGLSRNCVYNVPQHMYLGHQAKFEVAEPV